tara:strand:- start:2276 stop:3400 length:1125 start_codon:yes stop_codon:yes gene_type:complete
MAIYFDHNSTTNIDSDALQEFARIIKQPLNNSAIHSYGRQANVIVNQAKSEITKKLNTSNHDVVFTSGGTEANNLIIQNFKDKTIFTSNLEHSSVLNTAKSFAKNIVLLKFDHNGLIDINYFIDKISQIKEDNFLVSILLAHNEIGTITDIKKLADITHQYGGFFHSDIIQAVGKIYVDIADLNVDFASISGHKFGAPQGIGCVIKPKNFKLNPMICGGGQEKNQRSGTQNIANIAALGKVFEKLDDKIQNYQTKVRNLRDYLEQELEKSFGNNNIIIAQDCQRLPNTTLLCTKNITSDAQIIFFDINGIYISRGSACSSGSSKDSLFLKDMLTDTKLANYVVRISLGVNNSITEIDNFLQLYSKLIMPLTLNK